MKRLILVIVFLPVFLFGQWQSPRIAVTTVDDTRNIHAHEVIGNKDDTVLGTSIVALEKVAIAETDTVQTETNKIDLAATDGLSGVSSSLSYRVHEIERHLHNYEHWFETAASASGETHVASHIGDGSGAFQIDAGNDDWGSWVQILGSSDTPHIVGKTHFDFNQFFVEGTEKAGTYFLQFAFGASGAAALTANTVTEIVYVGTVGAGNPLPVIVQTERITAGTKAWARCKAPGINTSTLDLYFGLHEYEG